MMNESLKDHIVKMYDKDIRPDNRKKLDYRKPLTIEYGVIKTSEGSARVKIGGTEILAGVKMEVSKPYPDTPDQGSIIVGAELLPLSNPEFESGPPGIQAIELARVVDRGLRESGTLDFKKLCIEKGEKAWTVIIDICTVNDEGNLLDASSLAALAALKDAKFPAYDGEAVNYKEETDQKLPLKDDEPIGVTVLKIGNNFIVDPTTEEEKIIDARLTVSSKKDGTLCAMQKGGEEPLTPEEIENMVDIAVQKAQELRGAF